MGLVQRHPETDGDVDVTRDLRTLIEKSTTSSPLHFPLEHPSSNTLIELITKDCQGKHSWLEMHGNQLYIKACIQQYLRCKRKDPHNTSLLLSLPAHKGPWSKYTSNMRRLRLLKKGEVVYISKTSGIPYPPLTEDKVLYYDAPLHLMSLNLFEKEGERAPMNLPGKIAGNSVHFLIDTGASHNFIDTKFARSHRLVIHPENGRARCGGNN